MDVNRTLELPCNIVADIIVCFTTTNTVSATASYKLTNNINKYKMITTLTILIHLLVANFGAQQTPHLSLGLSEAQTCKFQVLWVETRLKSEYLLCLMLTILIRTVLSSVNQAAVVGQNPEFLNEGETVHVLPAPFSGFLFTFYMGKPC